MSTYTAGSATGANNVTGVAADYTSIANAEASGVGANNDIIQVIYIQAAIDTATVTLDAVFTGLLLTAHADAAVIDPSITGVGARARVSVSSNEAIIVRGDLVNSLWTVEKLSFINTATATQCVHVDRGSAIRRSGFVAVFWALYLLGNFVSWDVTNCFAVLNANAAGVLGMGAAGVGSTVNFYHCSILIEDDAYAGYYSNVNGTINCNGCIAIALGFFSGGACYKGEGGVTITGNYNVASDTTAPGGSSLQSQTGVFNDETAGTEDLTLTSTTAYDIVDRSGFPSDTDTDIAGTSRPSTGADAGVWQNPAAGGGNPWNYYAQLTG